MCLHAAHVALPHCPEDVAVQLKAKRQRLCHAFSRNIHCSLLACNAFMRALLLLLHAEILQHFLYLLRTAAFETTADKAAPGLSEVSYTQKYK